MSKLLLIILACMIQVAMALMVAHRGLFNCGSDLTRSLVRGNPLSPSNDCPVKPYFGPACRIRNNCYATCGKTQKECDTEFLGNMQNGCKEQGFSTIFCATYCSVEAAAYYAAAVTSGASAFKEAQTAKKC